MPEDSTIARPGASGEPRKRPESSADRASAGPWRLAVVSDTHGHVGNTRDAVRLLESLDVDEVLHCGDIGTPEIVELFGPWPAHFVFGNCDYDRKVLQAAIRQAGKKCHERFGSLELAGKRIAWLHGDDEALFRQTCSSGEWDLVCYGHTHVAEQHRQGSTHVLNPGALYRANPHTIAIVDLPSLAITRITV
jgi:putative phosphoesterase